MKLSESRQLPTPVFMPEQLRQNEAQAAKSAGINLFELMQKAGQAVFELIQSCFISPQSICVVVGKGNNAGDGFVVAALAAKAGWQVTIANMPDCVNWQGDAEQARQLIQSQSINQINADDANFAEYDLVVDAILGTGLKQTLTPSWQQVVEAINLQAKLTVSIDVPSGLNAKTGCIMGSAIKAQHTVTFIGLKCGLLTADAADCTGRIHFAGLGVEDYFNQQNHAYFQLSQFNELRAHFKKRKRNSHKGHFGHVLCIGGDKGMSGAIRMSAEAALRTGSGMVSVITHPDNVLAVSMTRPELMVVGINGINQILKDKIAAADVIVIGPGLGKTGWANGLMQYVLEQDIPKVIDADGLNWLAKNPTKQKNWVLTPHPLEAGRLIEQSQYHIQHDRFSAITELQATYSGTVVLKGCGSLIASRDKIKICQHGNPGMATAGSGDMLTGIIASFIGQGILPELAAEIGVNVHAQAGDLAAKEGERGMIATDMLSYIRQVVNQAVI
ncbi:NAD(P)H-hydrate dehydratase [Catenovulum adriaticum]|uniref:Bifunctional NAD(P)H-hydrate repair enzyme n=1 Tax=Catenovulum adriaticum TaxID=2984846 RepID=A0ABY7AKS2_9ALTE|nr:NAD(P)H-hydrate dehydratase [Catenovulum sp. TS8]WAJ69930.1 NAD(P)H-hydrate dehydratase [Catenovulum sp. TS8]